MNTYAVMIKKQTHGGRYRYEIQDRTGKILVEEGGFIRRENAQNQAQKSLKDLERDDALNTPRE